MSLFDTNIIEQTMYVRHAYDIHIEYFSPSRFYKWIWKEKGIEYPPRYSSYSPFNGIPGELLRDIIANKLGEIPADDFIKWVDDRSTRNFRRYFKKLIKREYMPGFGINFDGKDV